MFSEHLRNELPLAFSLTKWKWFRAACAKIHARSYGLLSITGIHGIVFFNNHFIQEVIICYTFHEIYVSLKRLLMYFHHIQEFDHRLPNLL